MTIRFRTLLIATAALALALPLVATAGGDDRVPTAGDDRVSTVVVDRALTIAAEQVAEGATVYRNACAECHGAGLEGFAHFPALVGGAFQSRWGERPVGDLHLYVVEEMPLGAGGTLSDEAYAAVVAYLLERNGIEPGDAPFEPSDEGVLELELTFAD